MRLLQLMEQAFQDLEIFEEFMKRAPPNEIPRTANLVTTEAGSRETISSLLPHHDSATETIQREDLIEGHLSLLPVALVQVCERHRYRTQAECLSKYIVSDI